MLEKTGTKLNETNYSHVKSLDLRISVFADC